MSNGIYKCCNKCGKDISIKEYNSNAGYCNSCGKPSGNSYSDNGEYEGPYDNWHDLGPNFK